MYVLAACHVIQFQRGCRYSGKVYCVLQPSIPSFCMVLFHNRNAVPFTATQVEAIRAGMQPGLTMVMFIFLNSLLDVITTIEVFPATPLSFDYAQMSQSERRTNPYSWR